MTGDIESNDFYHPADVFTDLATGPAIISVCNERATFCNHGDPYEGVPIEQTSLNE